MCTRRSLRAGYQATHRVATDLQTVQVPIPTGGLPLSSQVAKYRIAITKLRVSCHRLQIELGRYHKPRSIPPEQRLRKLCNCIEDEVYFVCVCPVYNDLRDELYTVINSTQASCISPQETNLSMLTSRNTAVVNSLAKFVHSAFKLHSHTYH